MDEVRGVGLRFLQLLINALPLPVIVMLIIAAINERIRRIVLWTMVGLTVLVLVAYVIFAPRNPVTPDDWGSIFEGLKGGFVSAIPYLVGLVVIGIAAYFIGPFLYESTLGAMDRRARMRYLEAIVELLTPQVEDSLDLTAQRAVLESLRARKPVSMRIIGEAGTGKSHLLRLATIELAKQALQKDYLPVPMLVDMDVLLASEKDIDRHPGIFTHPRNMTSLQSLPVPFTERMLRLQARKKRLIFLIDSSVQTFSREFLSPTAQINLLRDLASLVEYFTPCPFLITLPPGISHPELESVVGEEVHMGLLDAADIDQVMTFANIPTTGSAWAEMARRVLVLKHLVSYAKFRGFGIPPDLRELFRTVLYPGNVSTERVDSILLRMAVEIQKARRYTLPQAKVESLLRSSGDKRSSAIPLSALTTTGLLRRIEPAEESGTDMGMVQFGHPLYLAYTIALGWYSSQGQISVPRAEAYAEDPLLAEALVFFTNIETDPKRFSVALERLAAQDGGIYVVTQCLLAMPPAVRPVHLAVIAAEDLVSKFINDGSMEAQARPMLSGLEPGERLDVLKRVLEGVDPSQIGRAIRQITILEGEDGRSLENIRGLLWHASAALSREVAQVLAEDNPVEAFRLFRELFEHGPADKHSLALEYFGLLPNQQVEEYLRGMLQNERDPQLRLGTLQALISSGASMVLPLIERVGDREEADDVRIYAAQMLARSSSPEMQSDSVVREIVRVSRVPMPEKSRTYLRDLIESLRARMPAGVARWEAVVNPYVIGRPVTDPAMFFGREALVHEMRVAVENGTHMLLFGERRIGKTSVLRMFWQQLQDEARHSVPVRAAYLDLQGLQSNEFYETLVRAVIEQLHEPDLYADTQIERPYTDVAFERDIAGLMEYLHTKHGEHVRLAVLLDEADALSGFPATMQAAIRRVFTGSAVTGLVLILAGSPAVQRWSQPESPFFGMFAVRPVSRLGAEDSTRLITRPVSESFQYEPAAMQAILRATVGRPYEIQALCQRLVNMMLGTGERTITMELVAQALKSSTGGRGELLTEAETMLSELMDWVEMHPEASNAQVQERVQTTWGGLLQTMVQQVQQMRKTGPKPN